MNRTVILVEGGLVQGVWTDIEADVLVIDRDCDSGTEYICHIPEPEDVDQMLQEERQKAIHNVVLCMTEWVDLQNSRESWAWTDYREREQEIQDACQRAREKLHTLDDFRRQEQDRGDD